MFLWTFYSPKSPEKWIYSLHKIWSGTIVFNIDNIKTFFLSSKPGY